jgi:methyl-accepting chemotaxis protein
LFAAIGSLALGYVLATFGIGRPIARAVAELSQLANGDLSVAVSGTDRRDEIGEMARGLAIFKDNMARQKTLEVEAKAADERQRAEQAERQRQTEARAARMAELTQAFDKTMTASLGEVSGKTSEMERAARGLTSNAEATNKQSTSVAAAAEEATGNVQTVAAATEQLTGSINEINRQVARSSEIGRQAVEQAQHTNVMVKGLSEGAQKVGEVVRLINDIASQTNLLALNATIEAARAGDAGKGFAVVASEVKALANQTAKATEDIASQVSAIQDATQAAVQAIEQIGKTIGEISQVSASVASAVEEQGAATQEIARNIEQAAAGTKDVSANIGAVSQASGEVGAAASQVLSASQAMSSRADALKKEVETFLTQIRAA